MPRCVNRSPRYCRHKASGQAIVTIDGRDFYLGLHGTAASKAEYDRKIAEWLGAGRRLPSPRGSDLAVAELCDRFLEHARRYYVQPTGEPTKHLGHFKAGIKLLVKLYADTSAAEFGPVALETVRNAMIEKGWSRVYARWQAFLGPSTPSVGAFGRFSAWHADNLQPQAVLPPM